MRAAERLGIFAPQRHQTAGVIGVVVAEDHFVDSGEIDLQLARVLENGVRSGASIEQDRAAIHGDHGGKAPLADAVAIGQHRREDADFQCLDLMRGGRQRE